MEGLIPMVYKKIMRNQTRRHYECLSSGRPQSYNVNTDFYIHGQNQNHHTLHHITPSSEKMSGFHAEKGSYHRRHKSHGDYIYSSEYLSKDDVTSKGASPPMPKQLVRFRSHRMFSCVSGGA